MPDGLPAGSGAATTSGAGSAPAPNDVGGRSDRATLLGFANDSVTETALREGLADLLRNPPEIRRADIRQAIFALQRSPAPTTLIVDVSGEDQPLSALEDLAQVVEPNVTVMVIGDRQDMDFYRRITHGLGVREYLFKPLTADMVARHFGTALAGRADNASVLRGGRVLAIVGCRAGVGASTIATNLAWYLGEQAKRNTVLLDPDLRTGTAALMLGVQPTPALRNAMETPTRLDDLYVDRAVQAAGPRLSVLASEMGLDERFIFTTGAAKRLVDLLQRRYNFVIIDLPVGHNEMLQELRKTTHQVIAVLDPTLPAIRDTLRLLAMPAGPHHVSRPLLVLNRAGMLGGLTAKQVEDALQTAPDLLIPDIGRRAREAELSGKPAASVRGPMLDAVTEIARRGASVRVLSPRRRLLSRFFR
jgi:pilus assembly protein CpaE